jgi:hypothetical protein
MKREPLVPMDERLRRLIGEQRRRATTRLPHGLLLFPLPRKNLDGAERYTVGTRIINRDVRQGVVRQTPCRS